MLSFRNALPAVSTLSSRFPSHFGLFALRRDRLRTTPLKKDPGSFNDTIEYVRLTATQELKDMLFQEGPNYVRDPDKISEEPGILRAGVDRVGVPSCVYYPDPEYSDASRAARFQGVVVLSIVVTPEGKADSIYVVKGAQFGLTTEAIAAVQSWKFKPAQKDGMPVPVRVPVELTFRLFLRDHWG